MTSAWRLKSIDSPRMRTASWSAWKPLGVFAADEVQTPHGLLLQLEDRGQLVRRRAGGLRFADGVEHVGHGRCGSFQLALGAALDRGDLLAQLRLRVRCGRSGRSC